MKFNKKVSLLSFSHKQYKNAQFYVLGFVLLVASFCVYKTIDFETHTDLENVMRIPSLGTPKYVKKEDAGNVFCNDPAVRRNWGLCGTGGLADINADKAWNITQGSKDVVVAIIDTGIDENHPDLHDNLWVNPHPNTSNGRHFSSLFTKDDCLNDFHGCDFITNTGDLTDHHGHGTHIAGIIGSERAGVSRHVSLMILKYYDPMTNGADNLKNTVRAINYAVDHGAQIINYSGGGLDFSQAEHDAIQRARDHGILFIAAAGNERSNSDQSHYYPADYHLDNIISVTAVNPEAKVLPSSNYGVETVDIAAPGEDIGSTVPNGRYAKMTGTSQATAFVTGVAALIKANNPDWNYKQIKNQILATADMRMSMIGKNRTAGILNSWAALAKHSNETVTGLATNNTTPILISSTNSTNSEALVDGSNRLPALSNQLSQINLLINTAADRKKNLN